MTTPPPNHRWYHITPDRFFVALLVVQVFLLLSERFEWFAINEKKGWTVLIAVGMLCVAVLVMLVWFVVSLCIRRRFQFGVRSLLVFVVVVSIPLGWFAWQVEKARRQREAVEAIAELGGEVFYDYQFDEDMMWIDSAEPTTPTWLRRLLGDDFFCEVVAVYCEFTQFGDSDARPLQGLTELEVLWLEDTQVTDSGLAHLEELTKLQSLMLKGTQISDSGLAHLEGLTKLRWLYLSDTQVTDNGVANLQQALPNCKIVR